MFKINTLAFVTLLFTQIIATSQGDLSKEILVSDVTEFNIAIKKATPGTVIILKNGVWSDVHFVVNGFGTKDNPITIKAETAGEVIVTGDSKMNISGAFMVVSGLWFKDGLPNSKYVVEFRKNSKEFANNCQLTNCTISNFNPTDKSIETHWVDLWGKNNRVDHNNFTGKTNGGTTLVVWLKGEEHIENNHIIDYNVFGFRPELGVNGGETIRIGTSENSMKSSKTLVENNIFRHCNGEIEIISNKSGDNIFRNNYFFESEGTLTLRHGDRALVENNVFIGNNKPKTGGIRIIGEGHIVRNNLMVGLKGDDYRGPIVVMNGVPNSPLNRYFQVKDADIQHNTIINCGPIHFGAGKDGEKSLAPIRSIFANNLITNTNAGKIYQISDDIKGITFSGNMVDSEAVVDASLFTKIEIDWQLLKSLPMPTMDNEGLKSIKKIGKTPEFDINNAKRDVYVAGAFNLNNTVTPRALSIVAGPYWNPKIEYDKPILKVVNISVEPGVETLNRALKKAKSGDTILLSPGIYLVEKTMRIMGNITVKGNDSKDKIVIKSADNLEKPLNYFFRVSEGSSLKIENVTIDGYSKDYVKYAFVSPDENESKKYNLSVDNCLIKNFKNKNGGSVFKAYIGTMADTLYIKNSRIEDSYRGLNLSYEKDFFGNYNAENIILYNTVFKKIEEFAVNYTRTGENQLSNGGNLQINHCVFDEVANLEKGFMLRTKGIKNVNIKNTVFENSYNLQTTFALNGNLNTINNCLVSSAGVIKVSEGATAQNVVYKSPKWSSQASYTPSEKSPLLKENNKIERIGLLAPSN